MSEFAIKRLELVDMDGAAAIHRAAFDHALPWLAGLHTPEEDRWFFREKVFPACQICGALEAAKLIGIVAFREGWIDHLYVLPAAQGRGVGTALLQVAQLAFPSLQLWTFQRNVAARQFYTTRDFILVKQTDGLQNDEKEPDALYLWSHGCGTPPCRRPLRVE